MTWRSVRRLLGVAVLGAAASLGWACSDGGDDASGGGGQSTASSNPTNAGGGTTSGFNTGEFVSIEIEPASATIVVANGTIPPATDFKVFGVASDGGKTEIPQAMWTFDRPDIAQTNGAGDVQATGLLGGLGTLTATHLSLSAQAQVTVKLEITYDPENIPQNIKDLFPNASLGDPSMALLYPYDQTVFPRGLAGPVVQWDGGGAADIYQVHIESQFFEFTGWGTVPPPSRYSLPQTPIDVWRKLTDSSEGDVAVDIQRYDGAQAYLPVEQTWKIAPGNLAGTIYYWEVNQGNVVRLQPGATAPQNFLQKPPGVGCVACHSVSADGSTLVASFHGGYSPWGTFNTADGSSIYATDQSSGFQAISPDGSYILWGHWLNGSFGSDGSLRLATKTDLTPLALLTPGTGAPSHPAWSKDGAKVAFSVRTNGDGLNFTNSTLWVADVSTNPAAFANIGQIVANDAARPCVTYPTFSPDSAWIAFERSTQSASRGAQSEIWLTNTNGTIQIPLDLANGTAYLAADQSSANYEPTFNPVAAGGYFWLVIVSERKYGNTLTDTAVSSRRKQLWVTAIDANPQQGVDPSHPAFWLPGQELGNQNMRGEWALSPCKDLGEVCTAGYECCDGYCVEQPDGTFACSDNPGGCSPTGSVCATAADCCDPTAECINGYCATDVPS